METETLEFFSLPRNEYERLPSYPSNYIFMVKDTRKTSQGIAHSITLYKGNVPVAFEDVLSLIPENIKMQNGGFRAMAFCISKDQPQPPSEADFPFYKDLVNSIGAWKASLDRKPDYQNDEAVWMSLHWFNGDETNTLDSGDKWTEPLQVSGRKMSFEDLSDENVTELQKPAKDAADEVREQAKTWAEAEAGRVEAEKQRVTAEAGRAEAEKQRVEAEQGRTEAEAVRVAAENTRKEQEAARVTAETGRVEAETARVTAETGRVEAETARATAETGRVKAEEERVSAEGTRSSNETSRQEAEQARATAETERQKAESGRVSAESERSEAESARETAESLRVTAEQARNRVFAELAEESATATEAANEAAENANGAASLASENVLALDFDQATGLLSAVVGQDGSAFESGEITDEGDVILTFDY